MILPQDLKRESPSSLKKLVCQYETSETKVASGECSCQ